MQPKSEDETMRKNGVKANNQYKEARNKVVPGNTHSLAQKFESRS